ncbi:hypothetical protein VPH35_024178 [Triticum aestivum]
MNAEGIWRCVEEKEVVAAKECGLYERDLKRAMESCDELAWESNNLRKHLRDTPDVMQAPQRDKKILKTNLKKVKLFEEKRVVDEANKTLLCLLEKEQKHRSERKHSASNSTKQKRKSSSLKDTSPIGLAIDFNNTEHAAKLPRL